MVQKETKKDGTTNLTSAHLTKICNLISSKSYFLCRKMFHIANKLSTLAAQSDFCFLFAPCDVQIPLVKCFWCWCCNFNTRHPSSECVLFLKCWDSYLVETPHPTSFWVLHTTVMAQQLVQLKLLFCQMTTCRITLLRLLIIYCVLHWKSVPTSKRTSVMVIACKKEKGVVKVKSRSFVLCKILNIVGVILWQKCSYL